MRQMVMPAPRGKVGVCLVTSGPGAANLVTGIATANYDSVPLVCFTGQVPTNLIGKNAFQEVDIVRITQSICKYAVMVQRREAAGGNNQKGVYPCKDGQAGGRGGRSAQRHSASLRQ